MKNFWFTAAILMLCLYMVSLVLMTFHLWELAEYRDSHDFKQACLAFMMSMTALYGLYVADGRFQAHSRGAA